MATATNYSPSPSVSLPLTRYALIGIAAILLSGGVAKYVLGTGEYPVYQAAAERMLHGDPLYLRAGDPGATTAPFTYPPFFALPFVLLLPLPWVVQKVLWFSISLAAMAGALVLIWRCVAPAIPAERRSASAAWGFWLLLAVLVGRYVLAGFEMQSHDVLVVLLVALAAEQLCRGQQCRAGVAAGLAAACKATPLLFLPVLMWQRRFLAAACLLLTLVAATLLPDIILPSKDGRPRIVAWYTTFLRDIRPGATAQAERGWHKWNELNQGLAGTIYRLSAEPEAAGTAWRADVRLWHPSPATLRRTTLAAQLAVLALLAAATWPRLWHRDLGPEQQQLLRFGQVGAVVCGMLLLSPMSSKAHFAVLLLPVSFCVVDFLYRRRDPVVGAAFLLVLVAGTLTVKGIWGPGPGNWILAYGSVCWCTVAVLLATLRVIRTRFAKPQAA